MNSDGAKILLEFSGGFEGSEIYFSKSEMLSAVWLPAILPILFLESAAACGGIRRFGLGGPQHPPDGLECLHRPESERDHGCSSPAGPVRRFPSVMRRRRSRRTPCGPDLRRSRRRARLVGCRRVRPHAIRRRGRCRAPGGEPYRLLELEAVLLISVGKLFESEFLNSPIACKQTLDRIAVKADSSADVMLAALHGRLDRHSASAVFAPCGEGAPFQLARHVLDTLVISAPRPGSGNRKAAAGQRVRIFVHLGIPSAWSGAMGRAAP